MAVKRVAAGKRKQAKGFLGALKSDLKSKAGIVKAARFVCLFLASFLVFLYAVIPLSAPFWAGMGAFHAQAASGVLAAFGTGSSVSGNVITVEVAGEDTDFVISQLCSGDIEIALLASLLVASIDVLLIWRVVGALLGAGFLLLLNPLRIAITLQITKGSGMEAGDFYHSLIFRLFLFVVLVLYYFAWYRLVAKLGCPFQKRICKKIGF